MTDPWEPPHRQAPPGTPEDPTAAEAHADTGAGEPPGGPEVSDPQSAAAEALARARRAARAKGLRPGSKPLPRRGRGGRGDQDGRRTRDGRDPALLGDQLDRLLLDRGWNADVAAGSVMGRWPSIVGTDVAGHCTPVSFEEGILTVRCDSTAWATNLRLMSSTLLGRIETEAGEGVVTELRVHGPSAPSWKRGPRRAPGPGPRDTYG